MGENRRTGWFYGNPSRKDGWQTTFFEDNGYNGPWYRRTDFSISVSVFEDVIVCPALVVINAGTNDIAENAGAYNEEYTLEI